MMRLSILAGRKAFPMAALLSGLTMAFFVAPTSDGDVTCLLRIHVGHACPGCGMSRATGSFLHGDLGAAFAYHPYIFAAVGQALAFGAWRYARGKTPITTKQYMRLTMALAGNSLLLLIIWGVRLATGHIEGVY